MYNIVETRFQEYKTKASKINDIGNIIWYIDIQDMQMRVKYKQDDK